MYTRESMLEYHKRAHHSLTTLLDHCRQFSGEELLRELPGFGVPALRSQFHHAIGAEKYWIGVLLGRIDVDDDEADCQTIESLEEYRKLTYSIAEGYLNSATPEELSTARPVMTWGNKERTIIPAHVIMRTITHIYHHQGQIAAMCRILGKPIPQGLDYPIFENA
jgi:uncharacterized damage-inducible protein DinB